MKHPFEIYSIPYPPRYVALSTLQPRLPLVDRKPDRDRVISWRPESARQTGFAELPNLIQPTWLAMPAPPIDAV